MDPTEESLRAAYERNQPPFDEGAFAARLRVRTSAIRRRSPLVSSARRRSRLRVLAYSGLVVFLLVALTVGTIAAVKYLWKGTTVVVITDDDTGMSPGVSGPVPQDSVTTVPAAGTEQDFSATLVWKYQAGSPVADPVVSDGVVYVGAWDGRFHAVDAQTGTAKWTFEAGGQITGRAALAGQVVYVGTWDGQLYALDAVTGLEKWRFHTGSAIESSPVVAGGVIFVGSNDHYLYALDPQTGLERWRFETGSQVTSAPAVADGVAYFGSWDNCLYAVDVQSGEQIWKYETPGMGSAIVGSPALADGMLYFGDHNLGDFHAVDAKTGAEIWSIHLAYSRTCPAIVDGTAYFADGNGYLTALDLKTRQQIWTFQTNGSTTSSPAAADGVVYFVSYDTYVYAVDAATGQARWKFKTGDQIHSSPVVSGGVVYVGSNDGNLYALE